MDRKGLASEHKSIHQSEASIKEYRRLGRTNFMVSDIGCGTTTIQDENFLRAILKRSVNYLDSAYTYQKGNNERMIGRVIKGMERESVFITTKNYVKANMSCDDIISMVKGANKRLDAGYIDCFQMHCPVTAKEVRNPAFIKAMEKLKKDGIIRFCGLSCHGQSWWNKSESMQVIFDAAIDEGIYDLFLLVYNYVQRDMAEYILKRAGENDIATTLMKTDPFGGNYAIYKKMIDKHLNEGKEMTEWMKILDDKFSQKHEKAFRFLGKYGLDGDSEIRDAAIRFVLNNPDVHSVMITFQNYEDIDNYLKLSGQRFTYKEQAKLEEAEKLMGPFYCRHACGICEPSCPHHVPVNTIMRYNHYFTAQRREKEAMVQYNTLNTAKADLCADCPAPCEVACPFGVKIHDLLQVAHENLSLA
ncbi:MAG: aldo/keto reductase [Bacteroidales bacterium]|nr:aldo/keto reductase [Bacteroidales bacterium]